MTSLGSDGVVSGGRSASLGPAAGGLHRGFYDFAAAVVRPRPSKREYAAQLQQEFEVCLGHLRQQVPPATPTAGLPALLAPRPTPGQLALPAPEAAPEAAAEAAPQVLALPAAPEAAVEATGGEAQPPPRPLGGASYVAQAERARREAELSYEMLERYVKDTTTESKQRASLLECLRRTSLGAVQQLVGFVGQGASEAEGAVMHAAELQDSLASTEDDNTGLRHVLQQMLNTEGELRGSLASLEQDASMLRAQIAKGKAAMEEVSGELSRARQETEELRELHESRRPNRDQCSSPMMSFAAFVTTTDQVPAIGMGSICDWLRTESVATLGGLKQLELPSPALALEDGAEGQQQQLLRLQDGADEQLQLQQSLQESSAEGQAATADGPIPPLLALTEVPSAAGATVAAVAQQQLQQQQQRHEEAAAASERLVASLREEVDRLTGTVEQQRQRMQELNSELLELRAALAAADEAAEASAAHRVQTEDTAVQCELPVVAVASTVGDVERMQSLDTRRGADGTTSELLPEARQGDRSARPGRASASAAETREMTGEEPGRRAAVRASLPAGAMDRDQRRGLRQGPSAEAAELSVAATQSSSSDVSGSVLAAAEHTGSQELLDVAPGDSVRGSSDMVADGEEEGIDSDPGGDTAAVPSASLAADREQRRMRLLQSSFVEAIDLSAVPSGSYVMLGASTTSLDSDDRVLGLRQLKALIADVYIAKKADDKRRDEAFQERRFLHVILQELLRRTHGVKSVVHQKSWQLVESLAHRAPEDKSVASFCEFLDGSRDGYELSFMLYCSSVLAAVIPEDGHVAAQLSEGVVSLARGVALARHLFGDLKALEVIEAELEKQALGGEAAPDGGLSFMSLSGSGSAKALARGAVQVRVLYVEDLYAVLLEGWRVSALLLDGHVPGFSWRRTVLAFCQADSCHRGWLDPHEVAEAEVRRLAAPADEPALEGGLPVLEAATSLGAFIYRAVRRAELLEQLMKLSGGLEDRTLQPAASVAKQRRGTAAMSRRQAQAKAAEACLQVSGAAFEAIKKTLDVYLHWTMHSEDLRDLATCRSVRTHIYNFQQAVGVGGAAAAAHHLRSLLLLVLAHQHDIQLQQDELAPQHLDWELRCLMCLLREGWRRAAKAELGPSFGEELESLGSKKTEKPQAAVLDVPLPALPAAPQPAEQRGGLAAPRKR